VVRYHVPLKPKLRLVIWGEAKTLCPVESLVLKSICSFSPADLASIPTETENGVSFSSDFRVRYRKPWKFFAAPPLGSEGNRVK
jgi:hypothetical protein